MFGLGTLQSIGAAVVAALLLFGGGYLKGRMDGGRLTDAAVAEALAEAKDKTEDAINELSQEADRNRVRWRLCVSSGGVWSFTNNQCIEANTKS